MKTEEEIKKEFQNIKSLEEAKKVFKRLAKQLHPDIGGCDEEFKLLKNIYDEIIENKIYFSNENKFNLELEKIISKILHYEDITIEVVGDWIWLSGNTIAIKEKLKELDFKWASKKKMWYYGKLKGKNFKSKSIEEIKSKYGCTTLKSEQKKKIAA